MVASSTPNPNSVRVSPLATQTVDEHAVRVEQQRGYAGAAAGNRAEQHAGLPHARPSIRVIHLLFSPRS